MEYTYRLLDTQDLGQLHELYKAAFLREKKEHFFSWKYFNNPLGNAIVAGAFYGDKLAGSGAMVPEAMSVFGKEELIYKCTDLMTHPGHQKKGLSKKINELLTKETGKTGTPFCYTICSIISTKSFLKKNWIFLEKAVNFFKPYIMLKLAGIFGKTKFDNISNFSSLDDHLKDYRFKNNPGLIQVKKTASYLAWRTSNPDFNYRLVCHYNENKQVNGYLIYSVSGNNVLNVIDAESSDNNTNTIDKLLSFTEALAVKERYKAVVMMTLRNSPFFDYAKNRRYLSNPFNKGPLKTMLDFNIFKYRDEKKELTDLKSWDICGLSYDDI
jgi:Acetyltransferase (GNAT) domain